MKHLLNQTSHSSVQTAEVRKYSERETKESEQI